MSEEDQYTTTLIHEERKELFKIRFIPEIKHHSGVWTKLNNAEPIMSNMANIFHYVDPATHEMVTISLTLSHKESVHKETIHTKIEEEVEE